MSKKVVFRSEVEFKKRITYPKQKVLRTALLLSMGMNILLFLCLWLVELRVSKLESKHSDNSGLNIKFGTE